MFNKKQVQMRIAHLSDFHYTTFFKKSNLGGIYYLLKYAIKNNADHIVITGDLTDNADNNDFLILRQLFKSLGLLNSKKLSLVIGNHDIFGGVQAAEDIFTFPEKCRKVNFNKQVKQFYNLFKETFDESTYLSENIFPYVKIINGIMLLGMNSIAGYSTAKNIFASNGSVSLEQLNETINILERFNYRDLVKIILIHHHFNKIKISNNGSFGSFWQNIEKQTMKLRKKKRLLTLFKMYNIDLVMHGHLHETEEYKREGIKFLNAGGSLKGPVTGGMEINFIDIKGAAFKIQKQTLSPAADELIMSEVLLNEILSVYRLPVEE